MRSQVASRLSCFAILSAIETDLREVIDDCADTARIAELLPDDVRRSALARWEKDAKGTGATSAEAALGSDRDLLPYTDFADLAKILRRINTPCWALDRDKTRQVAERLEVLTPARNRVCHSRPLEPEDFASLLDFATWLQASCGAISWGETSSTMSHLDRDPRFVLGLRIPEFWAIGTRTIPNNLPLPDFDETGFLGRTKDRRDLIKLILSPHPVVSVVGAGGVGKTALLLRCLYDLLEAEDVEWDAIVWVSLKARVLTPAGVRDIESAVTSTLGVLKAAARALGAPEAASLEANVAEVREYLEQFRVVLALDNFETLSKDSLHSLLASVPKSSKVLLTSRLGLGEIELRYPLQAPDESTALALMRRYAQVLNQRILVEAPEHQLRKYVNLLFSNPLLIKWFVSAVGAGTDPRRLLDRHGEPFAGVMRFCIENLFERLTPTDVRVVQTMASARHPLSQSEMLFLLGDLSRDEVEWCLNGLQQASLVERAGRAAGGFDYSLSEMATEFVGQSAAPSPALFAGVQARLRELRSLEQEGRIQREVYPYDVFCVRAAARDERIAAAYLRRALEANRLSDFASARGLVEKARTLLPLYAEAYRVSAMIESRAGDAFRATGDYETALELDPRSTITLYAFAQFVLNDLEDFDRALTLIERAIQVDGPTPTLRTVQALVLTRVGRFHEAASIYEELLPDLPKRDWKKWRVSTVDQAAECYRRWAEQASRMSDLDLAIKHLNRAIAILDGAFDRQDFDQQLAKRLARVLDEAMYVAGASRDREFAQAVAGELARHWRRLRNHEFWNLQRFRQLAHVYYDIDIPGGGDESVEGGVAAAASAPAGGRLSGSIRLIVPGTEYGFIVDDEKRDWFFHRNHLRDRREWRLMANGTRIEFGAGQNSRGPCAVDVTAAPSPGA